MLKVTSIAIVKPSGYSPLQPFALYQDASYEKAGPAAPTAGRKATKHEKRDIIAFAVIIEFDPHVRGRARLVDSTISRLIDRGSADTGSTSAFSDRKRGRSTPEKGLNKTLYIDYLIVYAGYMKIRIPFIENSCDFP
jgi:hypothetical protein